MWFGGLGFGVLGFWGFAQVCTLRVLGFWGFGPTPQNPCRGPILVQPYKRALDGFRTQRGICEACTHRDKPVWTQQTVRDQGVGAAARRKAAQDEGIKARARLQSARKEVEKERSNAEPQSAKERLKLQRKVDTYASQATSAKNALRQAIFKKEAVGDALAHSAEALERARLPQTRARTVSVASVVRTDGMDPPAVGVQGYS